MEDIMHFHCDNLSDCGKRYQDMACTSAKWMCATAISYSFSKSLKWQTTKSGGLGQKTAIESYFYWHEEI